MIEEEEEGRRVRMREKRAREGEERERGGKERVSEGGKEKNPATEAAISLLRGKAFEFKENRERATYW